MIRFLSGKVQGKDADNVTILVGGVGYLVNVSGRTLAKLPLDTDAALHTYTHVRDDCLDLYGFLTKEELELFKQLITVSGIGPKTALGVMDKGVKGIKDAIAKADVKFFTGVPRLGQKNAQKIIIDLKNKLGGMADLDLTGGEDDEVVQALLAMGYSRSEAVAVTKNLPKEGKVEERVRLALKNTGK